MKTNTDANERTKHILLVVAHRLHHIFTVLAEQEYPSSKQIAFQLIRPVLALCVKATSRCSWRHQELVVYRYVYDMKVYHLPLPAD
jgi:hypothetical protein